MKTDHIDMLLNVFEKQLYQNLWKLLLAMITIVVVLLVVKRVKEEISHRPSTKHTLIWWRYINVIYSNVHGMKKFPFNWKEWRVLWTHERTYLLQGETMHAIEWYAHTLDFTQLPFFAVWGYYGMHLSHWKESVVKLLHFY